jgi:hypothetical protein
MAADLLSDFRWVDRGATEEAISRAETEFGMKLPVEYLDVLRAHDGGEGWVGEGAYLRMWPIEDLVERNRVLEADQWVPGMVLIGTDGADDLYAIEPATGAFAVFPAVGLSASVRRPAGESWSAFLQTLSTS